jgi:dolichyl-phosphate beta-glucosyltransferase
MSPSHKILICVPCFNEGSRIDHFIVGLQESLSKTRPPDQIDLLFIDDGSNPEDFLLFESKIKELRHWVEVQVQPQKVSVRIKRFPQNRGKGACLRDGFKEGLLQGYDLIGFLDADGATPFYEALRLIDTAINENQIDIVLGCRLLCLGKKVVRSTKRHYSGRIFATMLSVLYDIPVYDSQCGAKFFKSRILSTELLDFCENDRWLFDTQLVITLFKKGCQMQEVPVDWLDQPDSKISLIKDSIRMLLGLLSFREKMRRV